MRILPAAVTAFCVMATAPHHDDGVGSSYCQAFVVPRARQHQSLTRGRRHQQKQQRSVPPFTSNSVGTSSKSTPLLSSSLFMASTSSPEEQQQQQLQLEQDIVEAQEKRQQLEQQEQEALQQLQDLKDQQAATAAAVASNANNNIIFTGATTTAIAASATLIATRRALQQRQSKLQENLQALKQQQLRQQDLLKKEQAQSNLLLGTLGSVALGAVVAVASNLADTAADIVGGNNKETASMKTSNIDSSTMLESKEISADTRSKDRQRRQAKNFWNNRKQNSANGELPYLEKQIQALQERLLQPPSPKESESVAPLLEEQKIEDSTNSGGTRRVTEEELQRIEQEEMIQQQQQQEAERQQAERQRQQQQEEAEVERQQKQKEEAERVRQQQQQAEEAERQRLLQEERETERKLLQARKEEEALLLLQQQQQQQQQREQEEAARFQSQQEDAARTQQSEPQAPSSTNRPQDSQVLSAFQKWQQKQAGLQKQQQQIPQQPPNGVNAGRALVETFSKNTAEVVQGVFGDKNSGGNILQDVIGTGDDAKIKATAIGAAFVATAAAAGNALKVFSDRGKRRQQEEDAGDKQGRTNGGDDGIKQMLRSGEAQGMDQNGKAADNTAQNTSNASPVSNTRPTISAMSSSSPPGVKSPPSSISFGQAPASKPAAPVKAPFRPNAQAPLMKTSRPAPDNKQSNSNRSTASQPIPSASSGGKDDMYARLRQEQAQEGSDSIPASSTPEAKRGSFSPFGGAPKQPVAGKQSFSPFSTNPAAGNTGQAPTERSRKESPKQPQGADSRKAAFSPFGQQTSLSSPENNTNDASESSTASGDPPQTPPAVATKTTENISTPPAPSARRGSSPSQDDLYAKMRKDNEGNTDTRANGESSSSNPATSQQAQDLQSRPKQSFSPFSKPPSSNISSAKSTENNEAPKPPLATSPFGVPSNTRTQPPPAGTNFPTGLSPPKNFSAPLRKEENTDSDFKQTSESPSSSASPIGTKSVPKDDFPVKKSFSPFGTKPKQEESPEFPETASTAPKKAASLFGVSPDAKFKQPDPSKSSLTTPNTSLRPPSKRKEVKKQETSSTGKFNIAEANERVEEASKLSRDEEDAAREERLRIKDLQKARDRVMSVLSGGMGKGKEKRKSAQKQEGNDLPAVLKSPSAQESETADAPRVTAQQSLNIPDRVNRQNAKESQSNIQNDVPKKSFSPFGTSAQTQSEATSQPSTQPETPKKSFSPFGLSAPRAPNETTSKPNTKNTFSPFEASARKTAPAQSSIGADNNLSSSSLNGNDLSEKTSAAPKKRSFSPFGGKPKAAAPAGPSLYTPPATTGSDFIGTPNKEAPNSQSSEDSQRSSEPSGQRPSSFENQQSNALGAKATTSIPRTSPDMFSNGQGSIPLQNAASSAKTSYSPFGGAPKRPVSRQQSDSLYAPPTSSESQTTANNRPSTFAPIPTLNQSPTQSEELSTVAPVPTSAQSPTKSESPSTFTPTPTSDQSPTFPESVSPFASQERAATAEAKTMNEPNNSATFFPTGSASRDGKSLSFPSQSEAEQSADVPREFTVAPRDQHPGSLSSTLNTAPLPIETPAKPSKPFAASSIPPNIPRNDRGRLLDLESTRREKMDQMEGSLVDKLEPRGDFRSSRRSTATDYGEQATPLVPQDQSSSQGKILNAILAADDQYVPSSFAADADIPGALLQEVEGASLNNYDGKESVYTGETVNVYGESSLTVPVKVTVPGSIVSYTIERKSADFSFGVTSEIGVNQVETVKPLGPFAGNRNSSGNNSKTVTDNLLVSAGSTPCTLQFRFDNKNAMTIELGYRIRVIPPPAQTLLEGRRRRSKACLEYLDDDLTLLQSRQRTADASLEKLEQEFEGLERELSVANRALHQVREEEWRSKIDQEDGKKNW